MDRLLNYESFDETRVDVDEKVEIEEERIFGYYNAVCDNEKVQDYISGLELVNVEAVIDSHNDSYLFVDEMVFGFYKYIDDSREGGNIQYVSVFVSAGEKTITKIEIFSGAARAGMGTWREPFASPTEIVDIDAETIYGFFKDAVQTEDYTVSGTPCVTAKIWHSQNDAMALHAETDDTQINIVYIYKNNSWIYNP